MQRTILEMRTTNDGLENDSSRLNEPPSDPFSISISTIGSYQTCIFQYGISIDLDCAANWRDQ